MASAQWSSEAGGMLTSDRLMLKNAAMNGLSLLDRVAKIRQPNRSE
jgi:hypothetical protein